MSKEKNQMKRFILVLCSILLFTVLFSSGMHTKTASAKVSYTKKIANEKRKIKKYKKQLKKAKKELKKAKVDWKSAPDEGTGIFNADVINSSPLIVHSTSALSEGKGYFYIKNTTSYFSSSYSGTIRLTGGTYNYDGINCKVAVEIKTQKQKAAGRELRAYAKIKRIKNKISACRDRISYYRKKMNAAFNKVKDSDSNVYRDGDTINIMAEQSLKLNLIWNSTVKGTVKWSIEDENLLEIEELKTNKKYKIKAGNTAGTTTLKAKIKESGEVREFTVVVIGYPTSITVPETNITMNAGDIYKVNFGVLPKDAAMDISMKTDSDIIKIGRPKDETDSKVEDYEGDEEENFVSTSAGPYLKAVKAGTATITIKSIYSEYCTASATINVTVITPITGFELYPYSDSSSVVSEEISWENLVQSTKLYVSYPSGMDKRSEEYYEAVYSADDAIGYYDLDYKILAKGKVTEGLTVTSSNPNVAFPVKTEYYYFQDEDDSSKFCNAGTLRIGIVGSGNCDIVIQTASGVSGTWHITVPENENYILACDFERVYGDYDGVGELCQDGYEEIIDAYKKDSENGFSDVMSKTNYFELVSEEDAFLYAMIPYSYNTYYSYPWLGTPKFSFESTSDAFFIKFIQYNRIKKIGYICLGINNTNSEEEVEYLYGAEDAKTPITICMDEDYTWYLKCDEY